MTLLLAQPASRPRRLAAVVALAALSSLLAAGCATTERTPAPPPPALAMTPPSVRLPIAQIDRGVQFVLPDTVLFEVGKAELNERESAAYLDRMAHLLKTKTGKRISVEGHTDNQGPADLNRRLSEQRAEVVARALESRGVPAERMTRQGFSFQRPVAPNDLEAGRRLNRRTEVIVLDEKVETFTAGEPAGAFEDAVARIRTILEAGRGGR